MATKIKREQAAGLKAYWDKRRAEKAGQPAPPPSEQPQPSRAEDIEFEEIAASLKEQEFKEQYKDRKEQNDKEEGAEHKEEEQKEQGQQQQAEQPKFEKGFISDMISEAWNDIAVGKGYDSVTDTQKQFLSMHSARVEEKYLKKIELYPEIEAGLAHFIIYFPKWVKKNKPGSKKNKKED